MTNIAKVSAQSGRPVVASLRSYTASVYAAVILLFAIFGIGIAIFAFSNGNVPQGGVALAAGVLFAFLAWSIWTMRPWRYRLGQLLHGAGMLLGAAGVITWVLELVNRASGTLTAAGQEPSLANIVSASGAVTIDSLPLADALLLLALNFLGWRVLRALQRQEADLHTSPGELMLRRFLNNTSARVGGVIIVVLLVITYVMPRIDPYHGRIVLLDGDLALRLAPPDCAIGWIRLQQGVDVWLPDAGPAPQSILEMPCERPFGADKSGRDIARRVAHGVGVSLAVSVVAVGISLTIGTSIGLTAGYFGGRPDALLMRTMDIMLAFPALLLAIAIVAMRGPGLGNAMIAIGVVGIPIYARLARSMALTAREQEYVTAAVNVGAGHARIITQYILPASLAPLIVQGTLGLGTAVIETAALGFLGLGQQPPFPELGKMLAESREVLTSGKWWVMVFPGITVMLIVLGFNLLGDGLRDALDPRLNRD